MISKFRVKNVKGYRDTGDIELKPITILIGQNSSGKSSVMRFPLVLKQTILDDSMTPLLFYGRSIDYGSYEDVVFGHDLSRQIEFEIEFKPYMNSRRGAYFVERLLGNTRVPWNIKVVVCRKSNSIEVDSFVLTQGSGGKVLGVERTSEGKYNLRGKIGKPGPFNYTNIALGFDKFLPDIRTIMPLLEQQRNQPTQRRHTIDEDLGFQLYELYRFLGDYWSEFASVINYIGPFRRTPERAYRHRENAVKSVGSDGEFAALLLSQEKRNKGGLVSNVSNWLQDNLGFRLDVDELGGDMFRVVIEDVATGAKNNIIDVGHGLSQLIPIVIQTFIARQESLTVIEQPELHLHPAAQASLADLFLGAIKPERKGGPSFLIETHSEHLLLRLRRYIVEGRLNPNDIALYYSSKDGNQGSNIISRLTIDAHGYIEDWPEGFFAQDYQETLLLRQALLRKNGEDKYEW